MAGGGDISDTQSWRRILKDAAQGLDDAGIESPMADARRLFAHALGIDASRVTLAIGEPPNGSEIERFQALIDRRRNRQPVSQIVGAREFYGRAFQVTSDVLDPRPDTETLVDQALATSFETALDLGCGSGCILISVICERTGAIGVGVDHSREAVTLSRQNADNLGVAGRTNFLRSDWFDAVEGKFDLILSNPPYISEAEYTGLAPELREWEPKSALTPGGDGLDSYRLIAAAAPGFLRPGGHLIVEIGPTQSDPVQTLFKSAGLEDVSTVQDIDGRNRVVKGRYSGNNQP